MFFAFINPVKVVIRGRRPHRCPRIRRSARPSELEKAVCVEAPRQRRGPVGGWSDCCIWRFERAALFEAEANALLETYEDAHRPRVIKLGDLVRQLTALNIRQEGLFRQAFRCAENGVYLAAHVMAWAALIDLYEEKLASDGLAAVRREYPKWSATSLDDLRDNVKEFQLIDAGRKVGLLSRGQQKSMHGHLHTRNLVAHPTGFDPGINETLGYIEALIKLAEIIGNKTLACSKHSRARRDVG